MPTLVDAGDYVLIPVFNSANPDIKTTHLQWSQNNQNHHETYRLVVAKNITKDTTIPMFIQSEYYRVPVDADDDDLEELPAEHLNKQAEVIDGSYKLRVDSRVQYGQADAEGKGRFLVYHDKTRKPYQHRFIETNIGSLLADVADKLTEAIDPDGVWLKVHGVIGKLQALVGHPLRTFVL